MEIRKTCGIDESIFLTIYNQHIEKNYCSEIHLIKELIKDNEEG